MRSSAVNSRKGKLIAIEGTDGSGKGTQTKMLVRRLRAEGLAARRIAFPQYATSFFGKMVAAYLRGEYGKAGTVAPHLAAILYAADRHEARDGILRALDEGKSIVLDRYVDSNKAHQAANLSRFAERAAFLAWIDKLEYGIFKLPKPHYTIYLHVPTRIAAGLVGRKAARTHLHGKRRDMHEADPRHLRRAERVYMELAQACPPSRGTLIECVEGRRMRSRSEIADSIWAALLKRRLPGRTTGRSKR